jgi:hypothetical protein
VRSAGALLVNQQGNRFCNELGVGHSIVDRWASVLYQKLMWTRWFSDGDTLQYTLHFFLLHDIILSYLYVPLWCPLCAYDAMPACEHSVRFTRPDWLLDTNSHLHFWFSTKVCTIIWILPRPLCSPMTSQIPSACNIIAIMLHLTISLSSILFMFWLTDLTN